MKSTKKSFVFSLLSVLLCVSMLIGTTFAWFTDTAKSSNNRIVAGNLDVEMYWSESYDGPWHNVEDPAYSVVFGQEKWEPGYTEMRYFKIVNAGKLALKYQLGIEAAGVIGALADVIDVYYFDDAVEINERTELLTHTPIGVLSNVIYGLSSGMVNSPEGTLLPAGSDEDLGVPVGQTFCAIALHMQESAGNEYKNASIGEGFYITLKATQASFESDSFGSEYDDDVSFPQINLPVLATASVATDDSGFTTDQTSINENGEINALVQAGTKLESGTDSVMLSVTLVSQNGNVEATDGTISRTLDVHVSGVAEGNTVPVIVTINNALPINMELDAVALYHKENGVQNQMIQKTSAAAISGHNEYYYNSTDGSVVMALASFSEILFEANPENTWEGTVENNPYSSGEGSAENPYIISTVGQLAKLAENVNNGTSYEGVYFKLDRNLVINNWDDVTEDQRSAYNENTKAGEGNKNITAKGLSKYNDPAFEQQHKEDGDKKTYLTWTPIGDGNHAFSGHFDGNGHTISGLFKLHYDDPMDRNPMGLFGWIHDGSVKNLTVADSFIYTYGGTVGLVSAYASGETTFENISVKDNFVTSYNYPLGGILGMAWQANADEDSSTIDDRITFKNVTIDSSNLLEALWGTYDSAVGGIVGTAYPNTDITFESVTSWPELSLYNDCCANYQWFAYRYSGMLIGHVRAGDRASYLANNVHCTDVVVKYGEWTDQYYCERVELGKGSYNGAHEWKYQRISKDQVLRDGSGNPIGCTGTGHNHIEGKAYTYKGNNYTTVAEDEDHIAVNITFDQLFGGGQGVYGETVEKYAEYCAAQGKPEPGVQVLDAKTGLGSISVKLPNTAKYLYRVGNQNTVALGTLFKAEEGTNVVSTGVTLSAQKITGVTSVDYTANTSDWTKGTLQFTGTGVVRLILKYRGVETVLNLEVIDAVNATSAVSATSTNVCLLKDISVSGGSSIVVDNGYSFYGNGFVVTCTGNGNRNSSTGMGEGYVMVKGSSTLDNVQVIANIYPRAYMYVGSTGGYEYYLQESGNSFTENGNTYYKYQLSGIGAFGNATISNCYAYGARNNILIGRGNVKVKNTTCSCGALSNILVQSSSEYTVTLENVETIQYINNDSFSAGEKVEGLGILVGGDGITTNPKIIINDSLTQSNWVCSDDANTITSSKMAKAAINGALNQSSYVHSYEGKNYANMGIVFYNNSDAVIQDNRSAGHGYQLGSVSISLGGALSVTGKVYSIGKDYGSVSFKSSADTYSGSDYDIYIPHYSIIDLSTTEPDESEKTYIWNDGGIIRIQFPQGETFDFDVSEHILFNRYSNESVSSSISCAGAEVNGGVITFNSSTSKEIVITVSGSEVYGYDGSYEGTNNYSLRVPLDIITPDASWKDAVITCSTNTGTILYKKNSSDYSYGVPIFDGITILDYDKDGTEYTVIDGNNQTTFLSSIASIDCDDYNRTCFTIVFPDSTKLIIKCSAPYHSQGALKFFKYNNKFMMGGTKNIKNANYQQTQTINSYTYIGRSGTPVNYSTTRTFTGTTQSDGMTITDLSTNKFLMYDAQGGSVSPSYTGTSPATLPTPTRNGYTFLNWNTKADGTGTARGAETSMSFSSTTTLYAVWAKNVKVTFKSNGSTVNTISAGAGVSKPLPNSTQDLNWLEGWYTEADGGTKIGNPGGNFTMPSSDTTYYAHWSPKYYVLYDANGGSVTAHYTYEGNQADIYEGTALTLPTPTNGTKTFEGWFTAAEGGTKIGAAGDSYTPTENIELFAQWSNNILVTFNGNGGTAGTNSATYDHVTPITLPTATWAGHQFNGWYTASSGGTKVGNAGASYTPAEATTLYAQWTAYTVSFDGNGATNPSSLSAGSNGSVTLPTPTRTGYTLNGWYTAASGGTKVGAGGASYTPTADITLHAQWTVNTYKVTITTSNSSTAVTVNGTTVNSGGSVAYNSVVKVVLSYSQSNSLTFTIKQGINNVTYYSNEACTSSTTSTAAGTYYFKMPAGDVTINSSSKAGSISCVAAGTLITLADGTQIPVEQLTGEEMLLVWNLETGKYDAAPIMFIDSDPEREYDVINLYFSDGTNVKVISEHGFWDYDLNKYVYLDENAAQHIGHKFAKQNGDALEQVELVDVVIEKEITTAWSPVTFGHLVYFTNGMLSMPGGIEGLFNIFDVDTETMTYDAEKMQNDIDTYGLLTLDDYNGMITEDMFYAFNGQYLGIAVGKGLITWDYIQYLAERYAPLCE